MKISLNPDLFNICKFALLLNGSSTPFKDLDLFIISLALYPLDNLYSDKKIRFSFTPHLTPMFRGILSTIYVDLNKNVNQNKLINVLRQYYKGKTFIKIANKDNLLSTNDVIGTNKCIISVCKSKYKDKIILLSAIDNLIKGGSGQAVQNMNLRLGFKEREGIQ